MENQFTDPYFSEHTGPTIDDAVNKAKGINATIAAAIAPLATKAELAQTNTNVQNLGTQKANKTELEKEKARAEAAEKANADEIATLGSKTNERIGMISSMLTYAKTENIDITATPFKTRIYVDNASGDIKAIENDNFKVFAVNLQSDCLVTAKKEVTGGYNSDIIAVVDDLSLIQAGNNISQYIRINGHHKIFDETFDVKAGQYIVFFAINRGSTTFTHNISVKDKVKKDEPQLNALRLYTGVFSQKYLYKAGDVLFDKTLVNVGGNVEVSLEKSGEDTVKVFFYKTNGTLYNNYTVTIEDNEIHFFNITVDADFDHASIFSGNANVYYIKNPNNNAVLAKKVLEAASAINSISTPILRELASSVETGKYINANTGVSSLASSSVIWADVTGKQDVYIKASAYYGNPYFAFYTSIGGTMVKYGTRHIGGGTIDTFEELVDIPEGASYIVVNCMNGYDGGVYDCLGRSKESSKKWMGKKWVAIGDSLTERNSRATKFYHDYVADETGITVVNLGVGGTGWKRDGAYGDKFLSRVSQIPNDADVITVFGSGNDSQYWSSDTLLGNIDDTGTDTLCGCINTTIDAIIQQHPLASLGIVAPTPWATWTPEVLNNEDRAMNKYCRILKEIAERRGLPFLDLYHHSNLYPDKDWFRAIAYTKDNVWKKTDDTRATLITAENIAYYQALSDDRLAIGDYVKLSGGVHPDENGHKIIASKFKSFLETLIM